MSHGSVLIGTSEIRSQAQESGRYTPDPFPRERVGSGDETTLKDVSGCTVWVSLVPRPFLFFSLIMRKGEKRPGIHCMGDSAHALHYWYGKRFIHSIW